MSKTVARGFSPVPAAWRAVLRDGWMAEWQVYADNKPVWDIIEGSVSAWQGWVCGGNPSRGLQPARIHGFGEHQGVLGAAQAAP